MRQSLDQQFAERGFVVVRGMLRAPEIERYVDRLTQLADGRSRWTQANGVNRHREFWPVIVNPRLLAVTREILGPDIRYLPHNDLHLGFSSFSWHRDNVTRDGAPGADWDETQDPYRLVRVGIYLQKFADSHFRLGLIPGSHHADGRGVVAAPRGTGTIAKVVSGLSGVDFVGQRAEWIATEPGDCVLFDPRILHTGSKCRGPKFSIFVAYGIENSHFWHHWHYYSNLRADLGYSRIEPALAEQLRAAGLMAERIPRVGSIPGAWMPSPAYTYIARRFK
jgi:hypothetical protein